LPIVMQHIRAWGQRRPGLKGGGAEPWCMKLRRRRVPSKVFRRADACFAIFDPHCRSSLHASSDPLAHVEAGGGALDARRLPHDTPARTRMTERFQESGATPADFAGEFLVVCPGCAGCALVRDRGPAAGDRRVVLSCAACGRGDVWTPVGPEVVITSGNPARFEQGSVGVGAAVDWYFHLPLWLQMPCCGETLWAWNRAHLEFMERFVSASLRERQQDPEHGWSNRSLASRLPKWISKAKNRAAVQAGLAKLKAGKLADAGA